MLIHTALSSLHAIRASSADARRSRGKGGLLWAIEREVFCLGLRDSSKIDWNWTCTIFRDSVLPVTRVS